MARKIYEDAVRRYRENANNRGRDVGEGTSTSARWTLEPVQEMEQVYTRDNSFQNNEDLD